MIKLIDILREIVEDLEINKLSNALAWATVRGKPSKIKPFACLLESSLLLIMPITTSSGTNKPSSISFLASRPSSVPIEISDLRISPVDRWIRLNLLINFSDCVPLPAPGGPNRTKFSIRFLINPVGSIQKIDDRMV